MRNRRRRRLALAAAAWLFLLMSPLALFRIGGADARRRAAGPWPTLPDGVGREVRSHDDPLFSYVVTQLAGRQATVHCWSQSDWAERGAEIARQSAGADASGPWRAYAFGWGLEDVDMSPELCAELTRLETSPRPPWKDATPDALAWSVEALAHEAQHVRGRLDEAEAECYGMQAVPQLVRLFGRPPSHGRWLARRYWERWYAREQPPYWTSRCHDGGEMDVHPQSRIWP